MGQNDCLQRLLFFSVVICAFFATTVFTFEDADEQYEAAPTPPLINWNYTNCHHGVYITNSSGYEWCACEDGWIGTECSKCAGNSSCPNGQYCDTTFAVDEYKAFDCTSTFQGAPVVTAEFFFPKNETTGRGVVSAYHRDTGAPLDFNCTFTDCTKDTHSDKQIITCTTSECQCSEKCDSTFVLPMIDGVHGTSYFECDNQGNCRVAPGLGGNASFPIVISCTYAACQAPYVPPPVNHHYWKLALIITAAVIGFAALCIITIFTCIIVRRRERERYMNMRHLDDAKASLSFDHISCTIGRGKKRKRILKSITGICRPGQLTAILGPSGAGKTSFLDILAGRKNVGRITGEVLVNGTPRQKNFQRIAGYVLQDEKFVGTLTVREHLTAVAQLRLPAGMSNAEKLHKVDEVMNELGIMHICNSKIGTDLKRGISGGEKRRVSIATELVTDPPILFLDEPTSGLDSTSAALLVQTLVALSRNKNRTIITTIHQPSSHVYELFDNVMLLARGQMAYFGAASEALNYFANLGYRCPRNYNPADFLLDLVATKPSEFMTLPDQEDYDSFSELHRDKGKNSANLIEEGERRPLLEGSGSFTTAGPSGSGTFIVNANSAGEEYGLEEREDLQGEYASYWVDQLWVLCVRTMKNNIRNPFLLSLQYTMFAVLGVLMGLIFYDLNYDARGTQDRFGVLFFMSSLLTFSAMSSIDVFFHDRAIFVRERATGMYSTSAYFLAKILCDIIPMRIIPSMLLGAIPYYMIKLHPGSEEFCTLLAVLVLLGIVAVSLCLLLSAITPSVGAANLLLIVIMLFNMLFGGFLINKASMPKFIGWIQYTSFINYAFEILCVNEFTDTIVNFNPVGVPNVDVKVDGLVFLEQFDMSPSRVHRDFLYLGVIAAGQLLMAYGFLRFFVRERR